MAVMPYTHVFPHPIEKVYAWLTDYSEDDPSLAGKAVLQERKVVEREADRIVLDVKNNIRGRGLRGRAEVRLFPKEFRYEARSLHGDGKAILYTYQLTSLGPEKTRLDVRYGTRVRTLKRRVQFWLVMPFVKNEVRTMWRNLEAAMTRDLKA